MIIEKRNWSILYEKDDTFDCFGCVILFLYAALSEKHLSAPNFLLIKLDPLPMYIMT